MPRASAIAFVACPAWYIAPTFAGFAPRRFAVRRRLRFVMVGEVVIKRCLARPDALRRPSGRMLSQIEELSAANRFSVRSRRCLLLLRVPRVGGGVDVIDRPRAVTVELNHRLALDPDEMFH